MTGRSVVPPGPTSADAPIRTFELVHGGLRFRIRVEDGVVPWLDDDDRPFVHPPDSLAPLGDVSLRLHRGPVPADRAAPSDVLRYRTEEHAFSFELRSARIRFERGDSAAEAGDVWCAVERLALGPVLTAVAAFVAQRRGGLVVHGAAVELHEVAVLFVGPSGAGKSTAAALCRSGKVLAWDRAVLVPTGRGFLLAALGGGTPIDLPVSDRSAVPVSGVLRVRQARDRPHISTATGAEAFFLIRESTVWVTDPDERTCGDRVEAVRGRVRAASVYTVLGEPLDEILGEWRDGG